MTTSGAKVYFAQGSVVWVNGGVNNIGDSLYNLGDFTVAGDFQNDGLVSGNGIYRIGANWINNGRFSCGTSTFIMDNTPGGLSAIVPNQLIEGSKTTAFYNLTLVGVGKKSITLDDTVTHFLDLTDRELATGHHILLVSNTDPLAINRTSGFVSNLSNGWLRRTTSINSPYLFPVGSSISLLRYRPVEITTTIEDSISQYEVGFFNYTASADGFNVHQKDNTICIVDSLYYHKINRVFGKDTVDITMYYDHFTDGSWNGMANWDLSNTQKWGNMAPASQLYNPMWGVKRTNWFTWTNLPYALITKSPDPVQIIGPAEVCVSINPITYTTSGNPNDHYIWSVHGGYIVGDPTGSTIQIVWDSVGVGTVNAQEISAGDCIGMMASYNVTVDPSPYANFQILPSDTMHIFALDLIHFVDLSQSAVQWSWDFGDGSPSSQQNPYHIYEQPGLYTVCLTVSSANDCIGDTCKIIDVIEGIEIPNVFTPNGDGFNDVFDIHSSGLTDFHLQIFNRWGVLMFESESPFVKWDGKTLSGVDASDGTYYYVLVAKSNDKDYSTHGFLTLLRH